MKSVGRYVRCTFSRKESIHDRDSRSPSRGRRTILSPRSGSSPRAKFAPTFPRLPHRKPVRALGCIAPHAGYMYSGHVAGAVFAGIGNSPTVPRDVSQPHRHGPRPGDRQRRRLGDAAGRRPHRRRIRRSPQAALSTSAGRFVRAPQRARRRSRVAVPASAPASTQVRSHRAGHRTVRSSRATRRCALQT